MMIHRLLLVFVSKFPFCVLYFKHFRTEEVIAVSISARVIANYNYNLVR